MARTAVRGLQIADGANGVDLAADVTGALPVANGGTGATDAAGARTGIGLTAMATAATASTIAQRDANGNLSAVNLIEGYTTTATAAGTTTLTVSSNYLQFFTGSTTQTVTMPVVTTLVLGQQWLITNLSTGAVTVQSSGSNAIVVLAGGTSALLTCILVTGTSAASWQAAYFADAVTSGKKLSVSNTLTLAGTDATTITFQGTDTYVGRATADVLTNKAITPRVVSPAVAGTYTIDVTATDVYVIGTQNAAITNLTTTGALVDGQRVLVRVKGDATPRAITWDSAKIVSSGIATLLSTTAASKTHPVLLVADGTLGKLVCLAADSSGY